MADNQAEKPHLNEIVRTQTEKFQQLQMTPSCQDILYHPWLQEDL